MNMLFDAFGSSLVKSLLSCAVVGSVAVYASLGIASSIPGSGSIAVEDIVFEKPSVSISGDSLNDDLSYGVTLKTITNIYKGLTPRELLGQKIDDCFNSSFVRCEKMFVTDNRGPFAIKLVSDRLLNSMKGFQEYFFGAYPKSCDAAKDYINLELHKMFELSLDLSIIAEMPFELVKKENGELEYHIQGGTVSLIPDYEKIAKGVKSFLPESSYFKIKIGDDIQQGFESSPVANLVNMMKVHDSVMTYHVEEAKAKSMECDRFVHRINKSIQPIAGQISPDYLDDVDSRLSFEAISTFYSGLDSEQAISERIESVALQPIENVLTQFKYQ